MTLFSTAPGRLLALWGLVLLTGCTSAPPPPTPSPFNTTDKAWLQLMIPMNEQLLPALDLAPTSLAGIAAEVRASHEVELDQLRRLRSRAGLPDSNLHAGHQMPGLISQADLIALRIDPSGLGAKLREHLDQSALIARGEQDNGADSETKELARSIGARRAEQISRLVAVAPK